MKTGGADRVRRHTRKVSSRSSQWAAYVEFCKQERRALVPVSESQLLSYVGWLAMERETGRRPASSKSFP
jgi:hypothetical protein